MPTEDTELVEEVQIALPSVIEDDPLSKSPARQQRLLSFLLSKRVPPVLSEEERIMYPENPRNFIQYLFFWWVHPLYKTGYKRTIEDTDIYKFTDEMKVEPKYLAFTTILNRRIANWKQKNPTLGNKWPIQVMLMTILETFGDRFLLITIYSIVFIASLTGNPMVTKVLVSYVEKRLHDRSSTPLGPGVAYAVLNGLLMLFELISYAHTFDLSFKVGTDLKSVLLKSVFEKSFELTPEGRKEFPVSKITTLIGNDLSRIEFAFVFFNVGIALILGAIVSIALLIYNLGVSALPGIGLLLICCLFQVFSSIQLFKFRSDLNEYTDARVQYIRELITSFKTIKFYSWEDPYFERIKSVRTKEMSIVLKMKLLRAAIESATISLPTLSTMISFLVLNKVRGLNNIGSIFSSLSLFAVLGAQVGAMPLILSTGADAISGLKRAIAVIQCDKVDALQEQPSSPSSSDLAVEVVNANFEWFNQDDETAAQEMQQKTEEAYELQSRISITTASIVPIESILQDKFSGFTDVNLSIKKGEFVIVTGLIGSGKTSLLNAIAGSMTKTLGFLAHSGSMLLCGTPWVQNATVRDNITFGSPYDEGRYKKVLFACALLDDIKLLEGGDLTEVGERGVTLSGGQKARINLARAVYADKDILLLDDVLSAVDARVGEHIMKHCFLGLMKNKTRILATHQLSLITSTDRVMFLNHDGSISFGLYEELKENNSEFSNLLSFSKDLSNLTTEKESEEDAGDEIDSEEIDKVLHNNLLMAIEKKAVNHLSWDVYKAFFSSSETGNFGYLLVFVLILSLVFGSFMTQFINVWLSFWTEHKFETLSAGAYMGIYITFNLLGVVLTYGQLSSLSWVVNNASMSLVIGAVKRLLYAPMSFMDTTPTGRILNRFTKDTDVLDNEVYQNLLQLCTHATVIVGGFVLTVVYLPWLALSIPPLILICLILTDFSQSTTRETKRIDALRRSFVFDNINETLDGLTTIKAYGVEKVFIEKNNYNINRNNESQYLNFSSSRWLTLHLNIPSAIYSFLVSILAATGVFHIGPASTGLLLNAVLSFADGLAETFKSLMTVENSMNSAERLYQYSKKLEQESPHKISENTPSPSWPSDPSVEFNNVSLSYRPGLPLVLKDVSFKINGTEKVGICGRTGAGKSSIMTALYRIVEPNSGNIIIDNLDIGKMGLRDLRSKLTIIPQENVLFKGTIRYNLDPFGQLPDTRLHEALKKSGLVSDGGATKFDLDLLVEDEGVNFSLGEKQLIALARALSRDSNILILDEATSSVDYETDSKIQHTIKNEFSNCTVLCIAHRLRTILDYDKILVLDAGEVKEYDTPLNLYNKKDSLFRNMCESSNISELDFEN